MLLRISLILKVAVEGELPIESRIDVAKKLSILNQPPIILYENPLICKQLLPNQNKNNSLLWTFHTAPTHQKEKK